MTSPARAVAARVLERVERERAFADLALDAELTRAAVTPRDAALATELVYGTLRWQRYLDWILAPHSRRPLARLDVRPRALLRMTVYQIAFLERVPPFAAVDDAVSLAGQRSRPGVPEFVNAVLRSFTRRGPREREPARAARRRRGPRRSRVVPDVAHTALGGALRRRGGRQRSCAR